METKKENPELIERELATPKLQKEEPQKKWEGKATTKLNGISAEKIWAMLGDFFNIHKWLPTIDTCHQVEGLKGQPGLIRYCATSSSPLDESKKWCHEKLIAIDHVEHYMSYEVLDNNMGFKSYVATIKVLGLEKSCEIEWSFLADPVKGLTCEDLASYLSFALKGMAQNMENALQSGMFLLQ